MSCQQVFEGMEETGGAVDRGKSMGLVAETQAAPGHRGAPT